MEELNKLREILKENNIEFIDKSIQSKNDGLEFEWNNEKVSIISHKYSYGGDNGLLEMLSRCSTKGNLKAKNILNILADATEQKKTNIDKDIERCKELIKTEHSSWIGMSNQDAISNVLSEFEALREISGEFVIDTANLKVELETWKKIAKKLANNMKDISFMDEFCKESNRFNKCVKNEIKCSQCIIDWARKEVEK